MSITFTTIYLYNNKHIGIWSMTKHGIREIWKKKKNLCSANVRDLAHCSSLSHRWSVFFIRQETRLNGIDIADSSCNRKQTQHLASLSTIQRSVDLKIVVVERSFIRFSLVSFLMRIDRDIVQLLIRTHTAKETL